MPTRQTKFQSALNGALNLMRKPGARLVCHHNSRGDAQYYIVPGGALDSAIAEAVKNHPQVGGGQDGLWPGLDQTWRLVKARPSLGAVVGSDIATSVEPYRSADRR
jgi:hypothetical protein